jgi:hypothetical protein
MREALAYKYLANLVEESPYVTFIDNDTYRAEGREDKILETSSIELLEHLQHLNPRSDSISLKDPSSAAKERILRFMNSIFPKPKPILVDCSRKTALEDPNYTPGRFSVFIRTRPPRTGDKSTLMFTDSTVTVQSSAYKFAKVFPPGAGLPALASSTDVVINASSMQ